MREAVFLKKNKDRWQKFEQLIHQKNKVDPDQLADLYILLTDDLSYARTFYPQSKTTVYLNQLTAGVHQSIYKNKKENKSRIKKFWWVELPLILRESRKEIFYSFAIFFLSALIGIVSTANDENFVRTILGDGYMDMTLANIEKGDPMAVYKGMEQLEMFVMITFNNIRVSFMAFTSGMVTSVGAALLLFHNGIMLGSFQYFFHTRDLLLESASVIWIHGTIEILAIVLAGGAGIVMGNSFLFPGTYKRLTSFRKGANKGMKIVVGLIPFFIIAGFLESFVTRYTQMPLWIKLLIILSSLIFMIYYCIVYPNILYRKYEKKRNSN